MTHSFVPKSPAAEIGQIFEDVVNVQYTAMKVERDNLLGGVELKGFGALTNGDNQQVAALNNADMSRGNGSQIIPS